MLYRLVKWLIQVILGQFFQRVIIKGAKPVTEGPVLVLANHPYSLMDPLVIANAYGRDFAFMAKSTLFKGRIKGWLLRQLNMIPINRVMDGANQRDNIKILQDTAVLVADGRPLIVFVEGMSNGKRILEKLKNGPARIALMAEELRKFDSKLKIQVAGITYSDMNDPFKSTVTIQLEEPITVGEWKERYEKHVGLAARNLTERIETDLRRATVEVSDADSRLVEMIGDFYRQDYPDDHRRLGRIAQAVTKLSAQAEPGEREILTRKLENYLGLARELRVNPGDERPASRSYWWLLLAPLVYLGWALHYLPYRIASQWAASSKPHPADLGYHKLRRGAITFASWYGICALLLIALTATGTLGILATLGLFAGKLASGWLVSQFLRPVNAAWHALTGSRKLGRMSEEGEDLRKELEAYRKASS